MSTLGVNAPSSVKIGTFELNGISGVSIAKLSDVMGVRLVGIDDSLGLFDGKDLPLSLSAPTVGAPDRSYLSYEWRVPVTKEGIRRYAGWPRRAINAPSVIDYAPGEAATLKLEWSQEGDVVYGRYTSDIAGKFILIVNGCFRPAEVLKADLSECRLVQGDSQMIASLQGSLENPSLFDEYWQLERAWVGLPAPSGTKFAAYPVTLSPDQPLYFALSLGQAVPAAADPSRFDRALAAYEKTRMRSSGTFAGAAEAVSSLTAYSRAYDPVRHVIQTTVNRTWAGVNRPGLIFGWDNFFMSYSAAWDDAELAKEALLHVLRRYTERGINNGPTQRNLIIPVMYARTIAILGDWDLGRCTWPMMMEFMRFFFPHRDGNGDGLIELGVTSDHPKASPGTIMQEAMDESGYDESPAYSAGFGEGRRASFARDVGFDWKSQCLTITTVCQNALYVTACKAMVGLGKRLGFTEDIAWLEAEGERVAARMKELLFNEDAGQFRDRYWSGGFSPVKTMTLFFPLLAELNDEQGKEALHKMLTDPNQFWGDIVCPTVSRDDPSYCGGLDGKGNYWRGNCWPPTTYMVYLSAKEARWDATVSEYAQRTNAQFMEYYTKHVHFYENYPPEGKVDHDFIYLSPWGGRESHYVWAAMQILCGLEEIFGVEIDGSVRFGNPYLPEQTTWTDFVYQGSKGKAETGPAKTAASLHGEWDFVAEPGVAVRDFVWDKSATSFSVTSLSETSLRFTGVESSRTVTVDGKSHPFTTEGEAVVITVPAGTAAIAIQA